MGMKDSYASSYPNTCVFFIFVLFTGLTMASTFTNMGAPIQDLYSIDIGNEYGYKGGNSTDSLSKSVTAAFSAAFFVGAFVGSLLTFPIVEKLGRKLSTIVFCVSTIVLTALMTVKTHWAYLIVIRVLAGFPASCIQTVTPLWISETCPPHRRGIATVGIQLFLTLGILLSYIMEWGLISVCRGTIKNNGSNGPYGINSSCSSSYNLWYLAFVLTIVYLVGLLIFCFFIPERVVTSTQASEQVKASTQSPDATSTELHAASVEVKTISLEQAQKPSKDDTDSASFKDCFTRKDYRRCLAISIILPFLQQFTGINAVILFAGSFFTAVKMPDSSLVGAIIIGSWNFVSTIVAIPIVERMGRRFLLFLGTFILTAMLIMLIPVYVVNTDSNKENPAILACIMIGVLLYIFGFAIAPGPLVFTICGEIFPKAARVKFNSIAFAMHKLASIIVVFTFPYMQDKLWQAFVLYLVITIFFTILSWFIIPETKGKTLDEIEEVVVNEKVFEKFDMCGRVR